MAADSGHEVVCVLEHTELEIKGGGKKAVTRSKTVYAIQGAGDDVESLRDVSLPWRGSALRTKKARVEVRDDSGLRLERVLPDFKVIPAFRSDAFVSDSEIIYLNLPPLVPGDTLLVFVEYEQNPFIGAPPHVFGRQGVDCLQSVFRCVVPLDLEPAYESWNGAGEPGVEDANDEARWTWSLGPLEPLPRETYSPPAEDLRPVVSIGVNRIAWGRSETWPAIGASYLSKIRERLVEDETVLPKLPADDAAGDRSPAGTCLAYVQDQLRYVNIVLGLGGWIPRTPDEIFRRKYGDCKDMSTLLLSVLRKNHVGASLALVCTRPPAGHTVNPLPNLSCFNHAVVFTEDGRWLDATDPSGTEVIPREDIQGAPALVLSGPNPGFRRIPMSGPDRNLWKRIYRIQEQEDMTWRGTMTLTLTGRWAHGALRADLEDRATRFFMSDGIDPDPGLESYEIRYRSRDSLVLEWSAEVKDPVVDDALPPFWDTDLFPMNLFKSRSRETDVQWPGLFRRADSLVVEAREDWGLEAADSTWSAEVPGMRMTGSASAGARRLALSWVFETPEPVLPVKVWKEARREVRRGTRWMTRTVALRP